jgi:hypothetical protein
MSIEHRRFNKPESKENNMEIVVVSLALAAVMLVFELAEIALD